MLTKVDSQILNLIREKSNEKIETILDALGWDMDEIWPNSDDEIRSKCHIHDGDGRNAFSFNMKYGTWKCYSHKCDDGRGNIFNLVSKLLSKQQNKEISFRDSVSWLAKLLNIPLDHKVELDPNKLALNKIVSEIKLKESLIKNKQVSKDNSGFPFKLDLIKDTKPSWYFLEQGYSEKLLKKYYIGYCDNASKLMYLRSTVPILSDDKKLVVGVTGRIKFESCLICEDYHEQGKGCPSDNSSIRRHSKWLHQGFTTGNVLYNKWYAQDYIKKSKVAIIVESTKNTWRLEENDIHNSLGIFGSNLTANHLKQLIEMNVLKLVLGLDNDTRGNEARKEITKSVANYFDIIDIKQFLNENEDIAEMSEDILNKELKPFLASL